MADDHETALEEALERISGDAREKEDTIAECEVEEERVQTQSYTTPLRTISTTFTTEVDREVESSRYYCISAGRSIVKKLMYTPRNAHSDTEYSPRIQYSTGITTHYSKHKILTQSQFYDILYKKLKYVQNKHAILKQQAQDIAREAGKSYEDIMSIEWYDAPGAIKYALFDEDIPKELDILRKIRQKYSSSSSSYVSDSGIGRSVLQYLSSENCIERVESYLENQHHYINQSSDDDAEAQVAATMLMNNSVHSEELYPTIQGHRHFNNYPRAYSSDDSSSCFTATSHSSNSKVFVPRSTRHSRYLSSVRRMTSNPRRPPPSSRFIPPTFQQPPLRAMSPAVPSSTDSLLVAYTMDGFNSTLAKRVQSNQLTLGEFKEKVFARRGHYRFFFKSFCEELGSEILEEISEDSQQLPLYEGKIVGHVEKVDDL